MSTYTAKPADIQRQWFLVDAKDKTLGRLATEIAKRLRGKHKPIYTPHIDTGDFVIVVNVEKLRVTGEKAQDKLYYRHSGYQGGLKTTTLGKLRDKAPARILELAVKGMMPKGPLGRQMQLKLKIYAGAEHPHQAQQPQPLEIET